MLLVEVRYTFESNEPSAFKNCADVPPGTMKLVAVTDEENVAAPVVGTILNAVILFVLS